MRLLAVSPVLGLIGVLGHSIWMTPPLCLSGKIVQSLDVQTKSGWVSVLSCQNYQSDLILSGVEVAHVRQWVGRINELERAIELSHPNLKEGAKIRFVFHLDPSRPLTLSGSERARVVEVSLYLLESHGLLERLIFQVGPMAWIEDSLTADLTTDLMVRWTFGVRKYFDPILGRDFNFRSGIDSDSGGGSNSFFPLTMENVCRSVGRPLGLWNSCQNLVSRTRDEIWPVTEISSIPIRIFLGAKLHQLFDRVPLRARRRFLNQWMVFVKTKRPNKIPLGLATASQARELTLSYLDLFLETYRLAVGGYEGGDVLALRHLKNFAEIELRSLGSPRVLVNEMDPKNPSQNLFGFIVKGGPGGSMQRYQWKGDGSPFFGSEYWAIEFCGSVPWSWFKGTFHSHPRRVILLEICGLDERPDYGVLSKVGIREFGARFPGTRMAIIHLDSLRVAVRMLKTGRAEALASVLARDESGRTALDVVEWSQNWNLGNAN